MGIEGKGTEDGNSYEEFDSSEFETESPDTEETKESEGDGKADTKEGAADKKLTAEEAFGEGDEDASKEVADDAAKTDAGEGEGTPAYEPNTKYKVYDQEKEFPDQLKALVKDKATEDYFRDLLSKADGLDVMKPKHQEIVGQRDQLKGEVDFFRSDINRVLTLRDKQPHLFAAEVGITDDWIINRAKEIVNAKETPEAWDQFNRTRATQYDSYTQQQQANRVQQDASAQFVNVHQQQMSMALSQPEVSSFQAEFDKVHGPGSFQEEVRKHGYYHYERTKQGGRPENLAPMDAVKQVYEFHKKTFTQAAPQGGQQAADKGGQQAPTTKRVTEKPIPNVGKGRNVSPTGRRFKNIKEMREYVDKHVPSA